MPPFFKSALGSITNISKVATTLIDRRRARKSSSGLEFVFADSIEFVNQAAWASLAQQSVFLSIDYLRVLEKYPPPNLVNRYVLAYLRDGATITPVAAIIVQRIALSGDRLPSKSADKGLRSALKSKSLKHYGEHVLVCGNVLVWGERAMAFAPGLDADLLWMAVSEALYRLRRADKLLGESDLVMIKDFATSQEKAKTALRRVGYRSVDTEPDMVLDVKPQWNTIDDYLASLTSGYRSSAKKLIKDCSKAGIRFRVIDAKEFAARSGELHALYLQVHEAQPLRLATLDPNYLPALAQALGDRFRCRVAEVEGRALGFVTTLLDGETAIGYYIGYDRAANETAPIYLSLLRSCIEDALFFRADLGERVTQLSLGRTALEPKAKLGCRPQPLSCAVRHRISAMNPLLSALTRHANPQTPPERNPFKSSDGVPD